MLSLWQKLCVIVANLEWSWVVLWLGLAAIIVALLVLMRTRWGQSRPLSKCAVLSLLAHLLLAVYATTVQIVIATAGRVEHEVVQMTLVDEQEWTPQPRAASKLNQGLPQSGGSLPVAQMPYGVLEPLDLSSTLPDPLPQPAPSDSAASPSAPAPQIDVELSPPATLATVHARTPSSIDAVLEPPVTQAAIQPNPGDLATEIGREAEELTLSPAAIDVPPLRPNGPSEPSPALVDLLPGGTGRAPVGRMGALHLASRPAKDQSDRSSTDVDPTGVASQRRDSSGDPSGGPADRTNQHGSAPSPYRDRRSPNRMSITQSRGGSAETEAAVASGLKWLASAQSPPGHWDADKFGAGEERRTLGEDRSGAGAKADTAVTGLALLAFLAAGNTHLEGEYKDAVRRGLEFLLEEQGNDGNLGGQAEMFAFMYSHGIASLALSEAFAMTGDARLETPVRRAVDFTLAAQHRSTGGWRYRSSEPGDTSQLGWQIMALKSAQNAGIEIPKATWERATRFLESVSTGSRRGLAAYRPGERPTNPMTAEALVCRQFLGLPSQDAQEEAATAILNDPPQSGSINLYYWYYGTLGMFQRQGTGWERWNQSLQATLLPRQIKAGANAGSWDADCIWGGYGGRVYSTAMATLSLEVYYRYLPLLGTNQPASKDSENGDGNRTAMGRGLPQR